MVTDHKKISANEEATTYKFTVDNKNEVTVTFIYGDEPIDYFLELVIENGLRNSQK